MNNKTILITGGTGSFSNAFVKMSLDNNLFERIVLFSRDEFKQFEMNNKFNDERLRFFIGDVRDSERLHRACENIDYVIHAAALKQVPSVEYNPFEAIKTNIIGSQNVINACIDNGVKKVIALTTDKCCLPVNLYGATKLVSEKLFLNSNVYSKNYEIKMSAVRYGNIAGSRGSIIPFFKELIRKGETILPLTHEDMTRFYFRIEDAVKFVWDRLNDMNGAEVFIPKLKSFRIMDLIKAMNCEYKVVGIRQGEKLHEQMINEYENFIEKENYYIIKNKFENEKNIKNGLTYISNNNIFYTVDELKELLKEFN